MNFEGTALILLNIKEFWGGALLIPLIVKKIFEALLISVTVKERFESFVKFPFPLIALCFHVNPQFTHLYIPCTCYA